MKRLQEDGDVDTSNTEETIQPKKSKKMKKSVGDPEVSKSPIVFVDKNKAGPKKPKDGLVLKKSKDKKFPQKGKSRKNKSTLNDDGSEEISGEVEELGINEQSEQSGAENESKSDKKFKKSGVESETPFKKGKPGFKPKAPGDKNEEPLDKKAARKKQKLLKEKRKLKDKGYAITAEAKKIFEELRCKKCPAERREELSRQLFGALSGKISTAVRSHDLTRMIQWLIKVGPPDIKQQLSEELLSDVVSLSRAKYSNHIVLCMLKDCEKSFKKRMLKLFVGNVVALARNRFAAPVIEEYYSKVAKSQEKAFLRQELYSDLFKGGMNPSLTSLSEVLKQNPTLTNAILKSTKTTLSKLVDKKSSLSTSLVTDVLLDYLEHCEDQDKLDLLEILKNNIQVLLNNKSGSRVVMHLLWESTAKVKKTIVKELKTNVLNIAKSSGNLFLMSLFDSVDDTVLIKKAILPTILENAETLVKDPHGRKVILYLVAHRDPAYFHPGDLAQLKKADESSNVKKDISIKEKELLQPCVEDLLGKIKANPEFWFSEPNIALVSLAILKKGPSELLIETYKDISNFLVRSMNEDNSKFIEDAGIHMVLKKLIKLDPISGEEENFSVCFSCCLNRELIGKLVTSNRGCFLLVHLLETNIESVVSKIKKRIEKMKLLPNIEQNDCKGAQCLVKLLQNNE